MYIFVLKYLDIADKNLVLSDLSRFSNESEQHLDEQWRFVHHSFRKGHKQSKRIQFSNFNFLISSGQIHRVCIR